MGRINVTRPFVPELDEFVDEIRPVFESHILTNMGPVYNRFQGMLKDYLNVSGLSLFVNGHMALEMAIQAFELDGKAQGKGEVITTPFTFVSTVHAIARNGLTPVFCDIKKDDYCLDPDKLEGLINERTVAIIPVHVYGNICDTYRIGSIASEHGLKVIYDGAHAFGETYRGTGVGNFGDATMFSFHATKVFNTIEGGAVAFKDQRYTLPLHELKNFGIHDEEHIGAIGGNAKLDEFRAAMGICNLRHIDECIAARKKVSDRYREKLSGVDGIVLNPLREDIRYNYAYMPVYIDPEAYGRTRDDVYKELKRHGIYSRKYFYPALNEIDLYRECPGGPTPVAHDVSMKILTLPIYDSLPLETVDEICGIISAKGRYQRK
ncbi:MAG: DegT/DnrJ/EryC1/StrS family aminotransferase [Lachnospiraceae bacterium]|nr:DegT/DnrJ/EryC1/StrS family aminotransferase [Lachnospiraceae bacterium]